jgi:hypothetical protein
MGRRRRRASQSGSVATVRGGGQRPADDRGRRDPRCPPTPSRHAASHHPRRRHSRRAACLDLVPAYAAHPGRRLEVAAPARPRPQSASSGLRLCASRSRAVPRTRGRVPPSVPVLGALDRVWRSVLASQRGEGHGRRRERRQQAHLRRCTGAPTPAGLCRLGAGGRTERQIYLDDHARGTRDPASARVGHVHRATTRVWVSDTGEDRRRRGSMRRHTCGTGCPGSGCAAGIAATLRRRRPRKVRSVAAMMAGAGS